MAISHASAGQIINVRPLGALLPTEQTVALFKSAQLEVMRLVLLAGKSIKEHKVPGEITLQCIEGELDVNIDGAHHAVSAGEMVLVAANALHSVLAVQHSSALVTVVLRK